MKTVKLSSICRNGKMFPVNGWYSYEEVLNYKILQDIREHINELEDPNQGIQWLASEKVTV